MTSREEWDSIFEDASDNLRKTVRSINERIAGIKGGQDRKIFATAHTRNITNLSKLKNTINQLRSDLRTLEDSGRIQKKDAQVYGSKLTKLDNGVNEAEQKTKLTEAQILSEGRDALITGSARFDATETEQTRGMTNQDMVMSFDQTIETQDGLLDLYHANMQRAKQGATIVDQELTLQDKLIDNVTEHGARTQGRTQSTTDRMRVVSRKSRGSCVLWIVIIILAIVLIVQIITKNFGLGYWS
ncbi:hypothetical protein BLNAU_12235 [Blattamonas nauphoetae]|uniref:t-SNARE coiled-coil homology domain-containing protein n=1 Tax=Blattamonas nauphoetae TaxID=2049346 RepID=A0ABQ9XQ60_9EUKA|nr:hypothetical protein BLNAU_12235 [Blattamonas nauphoetae]